MASVTFLYGTEPKKPGGGGMGGVVKKKNIM